MGSVEQVGGSVLQAVWRAQAATLICVVSEWAVSSGVQQRRGLAVRSKLCASTMLPASCWSELVTSPYLTAGVAGESPWLGGHEPCRNSGASVTKTAF